MTTNTKNQDLFCVNCGQPNNCAVASGKTIDECWCSKASISQAALSNISEPEKLRRCLCSACATATGESARGR